MQPCPWQPQVGTLSHGLMCPLSRSHSWTFPAGSKVSRKGLGLLESGRPSLGSVAQGGQTYPTAHQLCGAGASEVRTCRLPRVRVGAGAPAPRLSTRVGGPAGLQQAGGGPAAGSGSTDTEAGTSPGMPASPPSSPHTAPFSWPDVPRSHRGGACWRAAGGRADTEGPTWLPQATLRQVARLGSSQDWIWAVAGTMPSPAHPG